MTSEQEILALNDAYIRSIVTGDVAWFDDHLARDFVCIESDASLVTREEFLHAAAHPTTALAHPLELFWQGANHGGLWRNAYEPRSVLGLAVALGMVQRGA